MNFRGISVLISVTLILGSECPFICKCEDTGQTATDNHNTEVNAAMIDHEIIAHDNTTSRNENSTLDVASEGVMNMYLSLDDEPAKANITYKVSCLINNTDFVSVVELVNSSRLLSLMHVQPNITSPQMPATCVVVFFYSPACPFSCMAAPHFNALPRVYPDIRMTAVDTSRRYSFNAQYGIVGLPSLLLFHNGRPAARFNSSSEFTLDAFSKFITNNTGMSPQGKLYVTSVDFTGPISSVMIKQIDYCLVLSWLFIIVCSLYYFYQSVWCSYLIEAVRSAWREAEAHQHID